MSKLGKRKMKDDDTSAHQMEEKYQAPNQDQGTVSWLKDIEMCVFQRKLSNGEAIQLVKDCTSDQARNVVEFYLEMTPLDHELL